MDLHPSSRDGAVVLAPAGRIDHASADAFQAALRPFLEGCRAGEPALVLDLHALDYISSVGLRVLMMASRQVREQAGRMVVSRLTPLVKEVFEISRFDLVFDVYDDLEAALAGAGKAR
jgi:anti-anti-sigma factor